MQRRFEIIEPKTDISQWVTVTVDSQNVLGSGPSSTIIKPTPRKISVTNSPNLTPKSSKVIFSPVLVKDTKDWLPLSKSSKPKSSSSRYTSRSNVSGSGLESSRIVFKPEVQDKVNVGNWVTVTSNSRDGFGFEEESRPPPSFNDGKHASDRPQEKKMSETVLHPRKRIDATNKVGEARKEIEKLKTELETLINTNIKNKSIVLQSNSTDLIIPSVEKTADNVTLQKSSTFVKQTSISPSKSNHPLTPIKQKTTALSNDAKPSESKTKIRTYDPKSTRDFIKKQKLLRKEKVHEEQLKKKESEELKKQKLQELRQRTLQLLSENVKKSSKKSAKNSDLKIIPVPSNAQVATSKSSQHLIQSRKCRPRSFDRDTRSHVNSKSNVAQDDKPWRRSRSVSREPKICDTISPPKSRKSLQDTKSNNKSVDKATEELAECVKKVSSFLNNELDISDKDTAARKIQATFRGYQQRNKSNNTSKQNSLKSENVPRVEKNLDISNERLIHNPVDAIKTKDLNLETQPVSGDAPHITPELLNKSPRKYLASDIESKIAKSQTHESIVQEIDNIKQKLESSITQSNLETIKNKKETPAWLLPPSTLPYPYNFISAVRKKLEIATKQNIFTDVQLENPEPVKNTKDTSIQTPHSNEKVNVSIQCKIESNDQKQTTTPQVVTPKPEQYKTFISHRCRKRLYTSVPVLKSPENEKEIVLDVKETSEIKNQEPLNNVKDDSNKASSAKIVYTIDSDSDTTKNIPEISEEEPISSFKKSPVHSTKSEHLKNITFDRRTPEKFSNNISKKSSKHTDFSDHLKNITFDRINIDNDPVISSIKSDISEKLKSLTFESFKSGSVSSMNDAKISSDIKSLSKPDYQIDTSKLSTRSNKSNGLEKHSSRSRYPSDIESILSHYSKMKSGSKSDVYNESNYSDDFNSTPTHHLSLGKIESNISNVKKEKINSQNVPSNTRDRKTSLDAISNSILQSLDLSKVKSNHDSSDKKHSTKDSLTSNIPTNANLHSMGTFSNATEIHTNLSNAELIPHSKSHEAIFKPNSQSTYKPTSSESGVRTSNMVNSITNADSVMQSISVKSDSRPVIQSTSLAKFENQKGKDNVSSILQTSNIPNLSKPTINLKIENEKFLRESKNNPNQIHLKFQAEVHLLNSFNKSFVAVEKSLFDLHDKENLAEAKNSFDLNNTSLRAPPADTQPSTVNYKRGCDVTDNSILLENISALEPSLYSRDLEMSQTADKSVVSTMESSIISKQEDSVITSRDPYVGVSLGMYDQMIRDEDNRLEHLKAILKLRDKALFDRTKGELAWLEIQKKELRESGQLSDVTMIKKKQRGLIIKLEQERHEMQRLKQAHKQAAKERKNALKEQKKLIKHQLSSTDQIPTKLKRRSYSERRQSGPLKVYRVESKTEHISETTMSRKSSATEETINVTTSSVVTQISEKISSEVGEVLPSSSLALQPTQKTTSAAHTEKVKRALLMKEADLEKRRKEAEELLKWHERLKAEEARVTELERQTKSIPTDDPDKTRVLTGAQLNKIWKGITGSTDKKFDDNKKYQMSKRSLDKFYQNARKIFKEISEDAMASKRASEESYTSDFDPSHSPTKLNISSSIITQINEDDLSISPAKTVSNHLRKISESSRLDFITTPRTDTNLSDQTSVSEKSEVSASNSNKKSVILSEILSQEPTVMSLKEIISGSQIESEVPGTDHDKSVDEVESIRSAVSLSENIERLTTHESDIVSIQEFYSNVDNKLESESQILSKESEQSKKTTDLETQNQHLSIINTINENTSKSSIESDKYLNDHSSIVDENLGSELHESSKLETHISSKSEEKSNSVQTSSNVRDAALLFAKNHTEILSSELPEESAATTDKISVSHITEDHNLHVPDSKVSFDLLLNASDFNDSEREYKPERISEIIESLNLDMHEISNEKTSILATEIISEKQSETNVEDIDEKSSTSVVSSDIKQKSDEKTSALVSDVLSEKKSLSEIRSETKESPKENNTSHESPKSIISSDIKEKSDERTSALVSDALSEKKSLTEIRSEIQESLKENNISHGSPKSIISSDIKEKSDERTSALISDVLLPKQLDTENISEIQETGTGESLKSVVSSEIKEQTDDVLDTLTERKSETEKLSNIPETNENNDESPKSIVSSDVKEKSDDKTSALLSDVLSEAEQLAESEQFYTEKEFETETAKSEIVSETEDKSEVTTQDIESDNHSSKPLTTENANSWTTIENEENFTLKNTNSETNVPEVSTEISFDIKQSDDKIVIEITNKHHDTSNVTETEQNQIKTYSTSSKSNLERNTKTEPSEHIDNEEDHISDGTQIPESDIQKSDSQPQNNSNISQSHVSEENEEESSHMKQSTKSKVSDLNTENKYSEFESERSDTTTQPKLESEEIRQNKISSEPEEVGTESIHSTTKIDESESGNELEKMKSHAEDVSAVDDVTDQSKTDIPSNFEKVSPAIEDDDHISSFTEESNEQNSDSQRSKSVVSSESQTVKDVEEKVEVIDLHLDLSENESDSNSTPTSEELKATSDIEGSNQESGIIGVSHIDVRKRVSEILADATTSGRGDKSPRVQDLYVTTYDILSPSPDGTPEIGSPTNEHSPREKAGFPKETPYRNEAEELLRKQLEIEQEIKQLERQQQNLPYLFMREIPNKPPPPYKPPEFPLSPVVNSVIPTNADQVKKYISHAAGVLYSASVNGALQQEAITTKPTSDNKITAQKFVFDLCKEIAQEVCKPVNDDKLPSWKRPKNKFNSLIFNRPVNKEGLKSVMNKKVLQLLNFEPVVRKDNLIIRWSRKKRDHVDEILVLESQAEEAEWTNYDQDEQTIKDNLTSDILDMLINETAQVMSEVMSKKKSMSWLDCRF